MVSDKAIAGLYFFDTAKRFVDAAMEVIMTARVMEVFYFVDA